MESRGRALAYSQERIAGSRAVKHCAQATTRATSPAQGIGDLAGAEGTRLLTVSRRLSCSADSSTVSVPRLSLS